MLDPARPLYSPRVDHSAPVSLSLLCRFEPIQALDIRAEIRKWSVCGKPDISLTRGYTWDIAENREVLS